MKINKKKKLLGTGEVLKPKGVFKNNVWMPPDDVSKDLIKNKVKLSADARKILGKRWSRKDGDGVAIEAPEETFARVAWWVAQVDGIFGLNVKTTARKFYDLLASLSHIPDSPVFTGSGTPLGQLAGCFVLPISDDMGRGGDGIFSTLRAAALIQQTGGGNGFSFSNLRERDAIVKSSMGKASGPVGFLRVYDGAFGEIAQGGTRRGANMGVLRVDHPDILEFIRCKSQEGRISNFNISVAFTDEFMEAAETNGNFDLVSPRDGKVKKTVKARELFNEIVKYAYHNGEPGALFIDVANRTNSVPHLYKLEATNPCGEQWLGPYESCCLGAVNLARHLKDKKIDWAKLEETVRTAVHFHDNIVSINRYVEAIPQLKQAAYRCRRIGVGIMGLADAMYQLRIRYGSKEGEDFAGQVMEFIRFHTMSESINLAQERGPFPGIKGSVYDKRSFSWKPPEPLFPYSQDFGRPELDWGQVEEKIKKYGIRNAVQQVIGPCGTKGTIAEVEGYGCEPVFALAYIRHVVQEGGDFTIHYKSPLFENALIDAGISERQRNKIFSEIEEDQAGGCQNVDEVPEEIKRVFVVSGDISAEEHVRLQSALQPFVDNSISKTCNFPATATEEDVAKVYFQAWKLGCKGLTVYVTGSRQKVILETKAVARQKEKPLIQRDDDGITNGEVKEERPFVVRGATYKLNTPLGSAFVTINETREKEPLEVFVNIGKAGSDVTAMAEALGRTISTSLRFKSALTPRERAKEIAVQLAGIGGRRSVGFGPNKILSLPDAVAMALSNHFGFKVNGFLQNDKVSIPEDNHTNGVYTNGSSELTEVAIGPEVKDTEEGIKENNVVFAQAIQSLQKSSDICPSCGASALVYEEGCSKCHICGYSEC